MKKHDEARRKAEFERAISVSREASEALKGLKLEVNARQVWNDRKQALTLEVGGVEFYGNNNSLNALLNLVEAAKGLYDEKKTERLND